MSKHTAGPWRFDSEQHTITAESEDGQHVLAELNKWEQDGDEYLANGKLISAAPDLYLAAVAALSWLSGSIDEEHRNFITEDLTRACLRAEGKEP